MKKHFLLGGAFFMFCCRDAIYRVFHKPVWIYKKRDAIYRVSTRCGTDGNRTSDTRIFSPLLYQLSYGTSVLRPQKYDIFLNWQEKNFKN